MSAAAVVTPIRNPSLFQIEERLEMLFGSAEFIDPKAEDAEHLHAMLQQEITDTLRAELAKVDGVTGYLAWLENQQAFAAAEMARLKARAEKFAARQARIEAGVLALLVAQQRPRIEGHTSFLAFRGCPPSVEVIDEAAVPAEYKLTTVTSSTSPDKVKIKAVLRNKIEVPGVRLITDKKKLVRG